MMILWDIIKQYIDLLYFSLACCIDDLGRIPIVLLPIRDNTEKLICHHVYTEQKFIDKNFLSCVCGSPA